MGEAEIVEFLAAHDTGVISFARGDSPYSIPVSYGFDESGPHLYVRFGYAPGSEKREFAVEGREVSFVVYDRTDGEWESVVAEGRLESVGETEQALDGDLVETIRAIDIPYVTIYDRPARELEYRLMRILPDEITGRTTAADAGE
jgi:hypothetical protein